MRIDAPRSTERPGQASAIIVTALASSLIAILTIGVVSAAAIGAFLAAHGPPPYVPPAPVAQAGPRDADLAAVPHVTMTDITREAGIDFTHASGAYGEKLLPESMGGGVAFFDYDSDGDADLLLVNSTHWPWKRAGYSTNPTMALYQNDGRGQFTNVTHETGLSIGLYGMGAAIGDYDGDGWSDVFISAVGPDKLLRNEQGKFVDVTDQAGVAGTDDAWGTSCCWLDYNRDGRLDLFVCNYLQWSREIDLAQTFRVDGLDRAYVPPQYFQGTLCTLYRNDAGGKLTDVSASAGIHLFDSRDSEKRIPAGKALGVVPFDLDDDGWQDLVVANDTVRNFLFKNRGDGTFEEIAEQAGLAFDYAGGVNAGMGIDIARPRNTRAVAVVIGNFAEELTTFHVSQGDGEILLFADEAVTNGLGPQTRPDLTFAMLFFDYDLDGRLDVLAANGHIESEIERVSKFQHYKQPPRLFWNAGADRATEFLSVPNAQIGEQFSRPMVGRGAAYADIDGDGDLDVVLTQIDGPARLLRNDQKLGHHWLRVRLQGRAPNPEALGAIVRVHAASATQERCVGPTHGYLSQSELPVTFGLGNTDTIDRLEIIWPDGTKQKIPRPEIDRLHFISQPETARAGAGRN